MPTPTTGPECLPAPPVEQGVGKTYPLSCGTGRAHYRAHRDPGMGITMAINYTKGTPSRIDYTKGTPVQAPSARAPRVRTPRTNRPLTLGEFIAKGTTSTTIRLAAGQSVTLRVAR